MLTFLFISTITITVNAREKYFCAQEEDLACFVSMTEGLKKLKRGCLMKKTANFVDDDGIRPDCVSDDVKVDEDGMWVGKPVAFPEGFKERLMKANLIPYICLSLRLSQKGRKAGGTMHRHQLDTFSILLEYGYTDRILLKAALVHDLKEDALDFNEKEIADCDMDGPAVLAVVKEVSRPEGEDKATFLRRILKEGSTRAKIVKVFDRISNMIQLGFATDLNFVQRISEETEILIFPMALEVNYNAYIELCNLVRTRMDIANSHKNENVA